MIPPDGRNFEDDAQDRKDSVLALNAREVDEDSASGAVDPAIVAAPRPAPRASVRLVGKSTTYPPPE